MNPKFTNIVPVPPPVVKGATVICFNTVKSEPVHWLWPSRIALGKVTMIAGDPGLGKSMIGIFLASQVSRGAMWPVDNTRCQPGSVMLVSGEDSPSDTIRPRLEAVNADLSKISFLECIRDIDPETGEPFERDLSLQLLICI